MLLVWLAVFTVGFIAIAVTAGPTKQRRSHFWVRVALASLALPALEAALVGIARLNVLTDGAAKSFLSLLFFVGVMGLMLVPGLLYRGSGSSPDPPDSDGGGCNGPGPPPSSPDAPRGGIPLPDADQASARVRDHRPPKFNDLKRRRPAHEPRRAPARTIG